MKYEEEKEELIRMQEEIASETQRLSSETSVLMVNNAKLVKGEYLDLINTINSAISAQRELNATRSSQ